MSWHVYRQFPEFQRQFNLEPRQRFRYLHRAADGGENDARFELAQQLRAGNVELGEDGLLRPVDTQPLQASLDYARHLLERAASTDHAPSSKALKVARERDWQAGTARRVKLRAVRTGPVQPEASAEERQTRVPWFLIAALIFGVFRACAHFTDASPTSEVDPFKLLEERAALSQQQDLIQQVADGKMEAILEGDQVKFVPVDPRDH